MRRINGAILYRTVEGESGELPIAEGHGPQRQSQNVVLSGEALVVRAASPLVIDSQTGMKIASRRQAAGSVGCNDTA